MAIKYESVEFHRLASAQVAYVRTWVNAMGQVDSLWWPRQIPQFQQLLDRARKGSGRWNGERWEFKPADCAKILAWIGREFPTMSILAPDQEAPALKLASLVELQAVTRKMWMLRVPADQVGARDIAELALRQKFLVEDGDKESFVWVGRKQDARGFVHRLREKGFSVHCRPYPGWRRLPPVAVVRKGWNVSLELSAQHPGHGLCFAAPVHSSWRRSAQAWTFRAQNCLLSQWAGKLEMMKSWGLAWQGDDPSAAWEIPVLESQRIPGWDHPVAGIGSLRDYQKAAVEFLASRRWRALIGDEMGLGKTASAIATAAAMDAQRIIVVCPTVLRHNWRSELLRWCGSEEESRILIAEDKTDLPDEDTRWILVSYDQIIVRQERWKAASKDEAREIIRFLSEHGLDVEADQETFQLESALHGEPDLEPRRLAAWRKIQSRLRGDYLQALRSWGPDLVILDEAHRAKNHESKRHEAVVSLSKAADGVILLTGTPVQNNTREPVSLLEIIDPSSMQEGRRKYTIEELKGMLQPMLLRRTKKEVLPELPPKIHQVIEVPANHLVDNEPVARAMDQIFELGEGSRVPEWATQETDPQMRVLAAAWASGKVMSQFELWRAALGMAKLGEQTMEVILNTLEERGRLVIFAHHLPVISYVTETLGKHRWRAAALTGKVTPEERHALAVRFQSGELDVLVCGMKAAGEGLNMHRADTVVFLELDWNPTIMLQAIDRIHRLGQGAQSCHIIHLLSNDLLDRFVRKLVLDRKVNLIETVLDEEVNLFASAEHQPSNQANVIDIGSHAGKRKTPSERQATDAGPGVHDPIPLFPLGGKKPCGDSPATSSQSSGEGNSATLGDATLGDIIQLESPASSGEENTLASGDKKPVVDVGERIDTDRCSHNPEPAAKPGRGRPRLSDEERKARRARARAAWKAANKEKEIAWIREWQKRNPDRVAAASSRWRTKKKTQEEV